MWHGICRLRTFIWFIALDILRRKRKCDKWKVSVYIHNNFTIFILYIFWFQFIFLFSFWLKFSHHILIYFEHETNQVSIQSSYALLFKLHHLFYLFFSLHINLKYLFICVYDKNKHKHKYVTIYSVANEFI